MKKEKMENSLDKLHYLLKIAAILTGIAIILIYSIIEFFSLSYPVFEFIKSVLTDIFAVIFAYLVISFVLDKKGISPTKLFQRELSEEIVGLLPSTKKFLTETEANTQYNLDSKIHESKEFYLMAYSFITLFDRYRSEIIEVVKKGTIFKIIILEPQSKASQLLLKIQKQGYNIETDLVRVIKIIQGIITELDHEEKANFEVRFMDWLPSYSAMISNPNSLNGMIRLLIYPSIANVYHSKHSIFLIINKQGEEKYAFETFVQYFEELWKISKSLEVVLKNLQER